LETVKLPSFRPSEILRVEDLDKLSTPELAEYFLVMKPEINAAMDPYQRDKFHERDRDELLNACVSIFNDSGVGRFLSRRQEVG
jgi:hypothetical protein